MVDPAPIAVLPMLDYANPVGSQPANGRLQAIYHDGGVTLLDPKKDLTLPMNAARVVGGVFIVTGLALAIHSYPGRGFNGGYLDGPFIAATAEILAGLFCILFAKFSKTTCPTVKIEGGRIYTRSFRRRGLRGKIVVSIGSPHLPSMQVLHSISIRRLLRRSVILFQKLSFDEAVWAKHVIETALQQKVAPHVNQPETL